MMSFQDAIAIHSATIAAVCGQAVTYIAGSIEVEIPDAVLGRSVAEVSDGAGRTIRSAVTDWLIAPARLVHVIDETIIAIEPTPGHRIRHTVTTNSVEETRYYEVQADGDEPCWRYSGPTRDRYRIHVREIPAF